jgi:hypothetical protein
MGSRKAAHDQIIDRSKVGQRSRRHRRSTLIGGAPNQNPKWTFRLCSCGVLRKMLTGTRRMTYNPRHNEKMRTAGDQLSCRSDDLIFNHPG